MTKVTVKRKRGRPSRKLASQAALAGVDLSTVDPMAVLRQIAADESAPASARVAAAKALMKGSPAPKSAPQPDEHAERDPVARRALQLLHGGKKAS
jgi:hypothetical protein